ncbi:MAG: 50S ribosomal protein L35ae [Candidatus Diapherotrites archaeon]|nr:50S ribosomal protein L35ae [Candidatus Diapherotrites archaeon]
MEGVVINYRRGRQTVHPNQAILEFPDESHPGSLVGKRVFWKSPAGKKIYGVITALHGRRGAVRARFVKGLPGQAIGDRIFLVGTKEGKPKNKPKLLKKKPAKKEAKPVKKAEPVSKKVKKPAKKTSTAKPKKAAKAKPKKPKGKPSK